MSTLNVNSIQTAGGASPVLTADIAKNSELIASSGSSIVGHIASGTGSVATTVQAKLRESVSVLDYYAIYQRSPLVVFFIICLSGHIHSNSRVRGNRYGASNGL